MPRLSQYIAEKSHTTQQSLEPPTINAIQDSLEQLQTRSPAHTAEPNTLNESLPSTTPLDPAATTKLIAAYNKRIRDHGPRLFRWPDGSLKPDKPPPNAYSVANRKRWSHLVHYCRTHGGDRAYESNTNHQSLRYGINVPHHHHHAYLSAIGLQPEVDEQGGYTGFDIERIKPLKDPGHAINSYYKSEAESVLVTHQQRGQLL